MQAIQAEAAQSQDLPQMSLSGGQHKLSMLYILDAVCSAAKQGQRGLQEKVRVQFRAMCSQILAQLVQMLATPVNCEKVRNLECSVVAVIASGMLRSLDTCCLQAHLLLCCSTLFLLATPGLKARLLSRVRTWRARLALNRSQCSTTQCQSIPSCSA